MSTLEIGISDTWNSEAWNHLPKERSYSEGVAKIIEDSPDANRYDRPWDDWQHLLADTVPWSQVQKVKNIGKGWEYIPSRKRHSWD